jgi:predicted sulfurtransferase
MSRKKREPMQECDSCSQECPQSALGHCEDCAEEFCSDCWDDPGAHASGCMIVERERGDEEDEGDDEDE